MAAKPKELRPVIRRGKGAFTKSRIKQLCLLHGAGIQPNDTAMKHVSGIVYRDNAFPHSIESHTHHFLGGNVALFQHGLGNRANSLPVIDRLLLGNAAIGSIQRIRNRGDICHRALGCDQRALDAAGAEIVCQNVFFHAVFPRFHKN